MSNPKFTPGPWIIRKERNTYEEGLSEEVWSIYAKQEDGLTFVADCGGTKYAGTHETARLISKAPEMFEALKQAERWLGKMIADCAHKSAVSPEHCERVLEGVSKLIKEIEEVES